MNGLAKVQALNFQYAGKSRTNVFPVPSGNLNNPNISATHFSCFNYSSSSSNVLFFIASKSSSIRRSNASSGLAPYSSASSFRISRSLIPTSPLIDLIERLFRFKTSKTFSRFYNTFQGTIGSFG
ncbi:MAG: hypothetical protein H0Z39_08495 [Peptococcaceae bacterium]|nr:hypothetical protein [Peptococcaceae bacterium]